MMHQAVRERPRCTCGMIMRLEDSEWYVCRNVDPDVLHMSKLAARLTGRHAGPRYYPVMLLER